METLPPERDDHPRPKISQPLTATQLRRRVIAQLALLSVNGNGKAPAQAVKP
jgi:hypothetical protein